jgi:hypothetical protein
LNGTYSKKVLIGNKKINNIFNKKKKLIKIFIYILSVNYFRAIYNGAAKLNTITRKKSEKLK